ncbi:MAG: response regulator transcription factor [Agathobacter sp.]|nr:response regulator transcription factor [Agathobacter sp.]
MHYQCLIVDDEIELAQMTCEYFQMFDVSCAYVGSVAEYDEFMRENTIDLLLLDVNLGQQSGFLLCKRIRETSDLPILFISARQSDDDMLTALQIGGDDYIKKPYTLSILLAKAKVMLKRMAGTPLDKDEGQEAFRLDKDTFSVVSDGNRIPLKAREFRLLECLYEHKNTIVTKEQLFQEVWGDAYFSDGTLNVHIRKLREKLERNPNEPEMITTIWGTGYMLKL